MPLALRNSEARQRAAIPAPWIPLGEAAIRLGYSAGHLRRLCADEWRGRGYAQQFATGSGPAAWGVHPSADPRLAGIESWRDRDLRQLASMRAAGIKPRYIEQAEQRRDLVVGFEEYEGPGRTTVERLNIYLAASVADGGPRCSQRTFYNWKTAYEQIGDDGGLHALVPAYGGGDGDEPGDGAKQPIGESAWHYASQLLNAGNRIKAAAAHTLTLNYIRNNRLEEDPAWRMPALRTFQLICKQRRPKPLRVMCDKGPRAFDAQCIPKGQRDYESIAAGECYIGDERFLDVLVKIPDDRRTWRPHRGVKLTAWIDERSRMIVGWIIAPFASSITICGSLKMAIGGFGIPTYVRTDWGKDYVKVTGPRRRLSSRIAVQELPPATAPLTLAINAGPAPDAAAITLSQRGAPCAKDAIDPVRVRTVLSAFNIQLTAATPYMPWAKSIESFFGTMKERFDKLLAGYIGGTPGERHEDRFAWAKKNPHLLPTIEEVAAMFAAWLEDYHNTPHSGHGMYGNTPREAMEKFRAGPIRTPAPDVLEFNFLSFTEPKLVRRDGVRHLKAWYGWGDPRLVALQGRKVILGIHPDDAGTAWVCDIATHKPLFRVECERHRFSTQRDAERIARARSTLRAEYSAPAKAARGFLIEQFAPPSASAPALPTAHRQPRLTVVNPALSNAIQTAKERGIESPVAANDDDCVRLEDMVDPFAADAAAIDEPDDPGAPGLDPQEFLSAVDEDET